MKSLDTNSSAKKAAGRAAATLIQNGMNIGLGTGSTSYFFIEALIQRMTNEGLRIQAVASSSRSMHQALEGGIPLLDIHTMTSLDVTVDGADEIDAQKRMIKGGGGALLREKILASSSKEMIVIVDESKLVDHLGHCPLPVEIASYAFQATFLKITEHAFIGLMRKNEDQALYVTDNGNYICDIDISGRHESPEKLNDILKSIPGVIETGFFFNLAGRVIVGKEDGTTRVIACKKRNC